MRERLRQWLERAGPNGTLTSKAINAANEAFINAVEHPVDPTHKIIDIRAELDSRTLALTIRDYGQWMPSPPTSFERRHYGYRIIHALADSVEIERNHAGTIVRLLILT
jgi:anti-sigma regulatory factor (Ser/Thr protein kinase)